MSGNIKNSIGVRRESNIELYRIVLMIGIVASHYVVNSGLKDCINSGNPLAPNSLFLLLFGCWGKVGINCFVLITGYFMCKSNITLKKFLKLILEWLFYKYIIFMIFCISGYQSLSFRAIFDSINPLNPATEGFTSSFVIFFLFIPFLNILVKNMSMKQHRLVLLLSLFVFSILGSLPFVDFGSNYIVWFMVLYLVSSYIRLYPAQIFNNKKFWGWITLLAIVFSYASVILMAWVKQRFGYENYFFFLADSHKITSLAVAFCLFMFFKNINIKFNPYINRIAASTFGVLCIHASSDAMRQWLWRDTCKNVSFFNSPFLVIHAIGVVLAVFIICTLIDQLRIQFIEKPFFKLYDKLAIKNKLTI